MDLLESLLSCACCGGRNVAHKPLPVYELIEEPPLILQAESNLSEPATTERAVVAVNNVAAPKSWPAFNASAGVFFQLPRDLQFTVLLEWIPSAREYSTMDVATCSRTKRKLWLALLSDPVLCVDLSFSAAPDVGYYLWLTNRALHVSVLHFNTNGSTSHFNYAAYRFPASVETVVLMGNQCTDFVFSGHAYAAALKRIPNLTKLTSRSFVGSLGSKSLQDLATLTATLKVLEIVDTGTGNRSLDFPFHLCVFLLAFRFGSTLEVLHLKIDGMPSGGADGELMCQIRSRCLLLRALRLPGISFHFQDILAMSESHPTLTALECKVDFSRCSEPKPFDEACVRIMEKFSDLELLSVFGCRVKADSLPLECYPKLMRFATDDLCVNVTAANSSFTINSHSNTQTDPQTACQLLLNMPSSVKTIACSGSHFRSTISNPVLLAIADKHGVALERWTNFHYATSMDNATLEQFLVLCPRISSLEIPHSQHLTCDAVLHVGDHCSNLTALVMTIPDVTDDALRALLTRCTKLRKLCLPGQLLSSAVFDLFAQLTMLGFTSDRLKFSVNEMITAITRGNFRKLQALRLRQSDLLQYVAAALRITAVVGRKLIVEEYKNATDFL